MPVVVHLLVFGVAVVCLYSMCTFVCVQRELGCLKCAYLSQSVHLFWLCARVCGDDSLEFGASPFQTLIITCNPKPQRRQCVERVEDEGNGS